LTNDLKVRDQIRSLPKKIKMKDDKEFYSSMDTSYLHLGFKSCFPQLLREKKRGEQKIIKKKMHIMYVFFKHKIIKNMHKMSNCHLNTWICPYRTKCRSTNLI